MNIDKFFSSNIYFVIPGPKSPKVFLAIDNKQISYNSFKLYNPFSFRAKILKIILRCLFVNYNSLAKFILPTLKAEKSDFISYLEKKINKKITSSIYISTDLDKLVIQLSNKEGIIGYAKYPLNDFGSKRIITEKNAIKTLSKKKIISPLIFSSLYINRPLIIIKNEKGVQKKVDSNIYRFTLDLFKKKNKQKLRNHKRIKSIKIDLLKYELHDLNVILNSLILKSNYKYFEAYEHGDFAPWNLLYSDEGLIPFDFEFFVENGIEYFDEIKYHFQIEHLLNFKKDFDLISSIKQKTRIKEFYIVFTIYLIKEIICKIKNANTYSHEYSLIKLICKEKFNDII